MEMLKHCTLFFVFFLLPITCFAQTNLEEKATSTFDIALDLDNAYGFYPGVYGSFGLNKRLSLTFYALMWTNPTYGVPTPSQGTDLWLETGIGIGFSVFSENLYVNPSVGITHGKVLSGGENSLVGEGITPNLVLTSIHDKIDGELYVGYYDALRKGGDIQYKLIQYWLYTGMFVHENIALGLHYEIYSLGDSETSLQKQYEWLGGYVKFLIGEKYSFRFATGKNFLENDQFSPEYYKLSLYLSFM